VASAEVDDWTPLSTRDQPVEADELYEGIPEHLERPLVNWLGSYLNHTRRRPLAERVALRLRLQLDLDSEPAVGLVKAASAAGNLLDIIDTAIHIDDYLRWEVEAVGPMLNDAAAVLDWVPDLVWPEGSVLAHAVEALDEILIDGGSAYTIDWNRRCLMRRLGPVVQQAARISMSARNAAGAHLAAAWSATYGVRPDPAKAYDESVRAVEAASIPLVLPNEGQPTLGKVHAHFRNAPHLWVLAIEGKNNGAIDPLTSMIGLLWFGHSPSRHAGGPASRPQRQDEAEMAVHLAAILVQWFTSRAVRRRNPAPAPRAGS
jgi:hypothetical protein